MILALPAVKPVTTPVPAFTVATVVLLLLQLPPLKPLLLKVACEPAQTVAAPLTLPALGSGFTVMSNDVVDELQPLLSWYWMVVLPAARTVNVPDVGSIVATPVLVLLHVPP